MQGMFQQPAEVPKELDFRGSRDFMRPAVRLFQLFDQFGYWIASNEYNYQSVDGCCAEYVFVRPDLP